MIFAALAVSLMSCAASAPQQAIAPAVEKPTQTDPVVKLAQVAEKTKNEAKKVAKKPDVSNAYLIQIIGLVHKLDIAVAAMKQHRTKASMDTVKSTVGELHRVTE